VLADSTVFSAEGMLTCDVTHTAEASRVVSTPFTDQSLAGLTARFSRLEQRVIDQFALEGAGPDEVSLARTLGVRFRQQVHTVEVAVDPGTLDAAAGERVLERFVERYGLLYGEGALLLGGGNEVELHRVVGTRPIEPVAFPEHDSAGPDASAALKGERSAYFEPAGFTATAVYDGDAPACRKRDRRSRDHRADGRQHGCPTGLPRAGRSPAHDPPRCRGGSGCQRHGTREPRRGRVMAGSSGLVAEPTQSLGRPRSGHLRGDPATACGRSTTTRAGWRRACPGRSSSSRAMTSNAALVTADGRGLYCGMYILQHGATIDEFVRRVLAEWPAEEIREGDMFFTNDPWWGRCTPTTGSWRCRSSGRASWSPGRGSRCTTRTSAARCRAASSPVPLTALARRRCFPRLDGQGFCSSAGRGCDAYLPQHPDLCS